MSLEVFHQGYRISDDPALLDVDAIHKLLEQTYWAEGITRERVAASLQGSFAVGIYEEHKIQVGLLRLITDFATYGYLCDVCVAPAHRRKGLARAGLTFLLAHPRLQTLRRFHLVTRDAHELYASVGFKPLLQPERQMEKRLV